MGGSKYHLWHSPESPASLETTSDQTIVGRAIKAKKKKELHSVKGESLVPRDTNEKKKKRCVQKPKAGKGWIQCSTKSATATATAGRRRARAGERVAD